MATRNGGGVALYIRNSIAYEIIQNLDEKLELLCVKVIKPKAKPFIVGTWYRPPGSTNEIMQAYRDNEIMKTVVSFRRYW